MNNYYNGYGGYSNGRFLTTQPYQPYQQFMPRQEQVQQPNGIFFNNIRYISSEDMDKYIVNLGNTDMLINMEDKLVKIKSADMAGNSFERNFKFEEIKDVSQVQNKKQGIDLDLYVKKEDLKDFIKADALTQFSAQLDEKFDKLEKKIKIHDILEDKK